MLERVIGKFPYVAILERHRKVNFMHVAWCGKVPLDIVRRCQLRCCGAGARDGQFAVHQIARWDWAAIIARYISKYVTKAFDQVANYRFNKKRYWASRQTMPEVRRYILKSKTLAKCYRS